MFVIVDSECEADARDEGEPPARPILYYEHEVFVIVDSECEAGARDEGEPPARPVLYCGKSTI